MKTITVIATMFLVLSFVSGVFAEKGPEYDKALQYYESGNYKESVRIFQDYVKKKPEAAAYYRIGYGLYMLGKYNEAEAYFKQAYLIDPAFSPGPVGPPQKYPEKRIKKDKKTSRKKAHSKKETTLSKTGEKHSEMKPDSVPERAPSKEAQPEKPKQK